MISYFRWMRFSISCPATGVILAASGSRLIAAGAEGARARVRHSDRVCISNQGPGAGRSTSCKTSSNVRQEHHEWAPPIVFALAFGSRWPSSPCCAGDRDPFGVGGLIGAAASRSGHLDRRSAWRCARRLGLVLARLPLQSAISQMAVVPATRPGTEGQAALQEMGDNWISLGRFFGPLRSAVPLVAGFARCR